MKKKILVVDEKRVHRVIFRVILGNYGYRVLEAEGVNSALATFDREQPIALITDYNLRDEEGTGIDLVKRLRDRKVGIHMIVMSRDPRLAPEAKDAGAVFWDKNREPLGIVSFLP